MGDEYIRKQDAVDMVAFGITIAAAFNQETGERIDLFTKENDELRKAIKRIHDLPPANVLHYTIDPDGTLTITVPKGTTVNRVLVQEDGTQWGGLFYAD